MPVPRSKKLRALQKTYGQPWWTVALRWADEPIAQREIADRWTAAVGAVVPGMRFSQQEVCRIIRRAEIARATETTRDAAAV